MRRFALALAAWLAGLLWLGAAQAHEVRPAYLEIAQEAPGGWRILWKQPVQGELALPLSPRLSNGWLDGPPAETSVTGAHLIKVWRIRDAGRAPLEGAVVGVDGLDGAITDVLLRVSATDGRSVEAILGPERPSFAVDFGAERRILPAPAYLKLGIEHILAGIDHLAFVLCLLLLVGVNGRLVGAVTAFTAAHSLTLAAAALGWVQVSSAAVETLVALSILFVALEVIRAQRGQGGLTLRRPWLIAFAFGLLHGFAFAGALAEIGLPRTAIPQALFLFNVGVEIGQLIFVAAAGAALIAARRLTAAASLPGRVLVLARAAPVYAIGAFAAFWVFERAALALHLSA